MAFSMNSGYAGWSMSKNAVDAYRGGEKPFSKWTKTVLLDAIFEDKEVVFTKTEIKKYKLADVQQQADFAEQWEGNYWNYKHLKSYIDIPCYVYKDWAYTEKFGKKSLASNHVKEPKYLVRAPKGMAEDFKRIKESLPKTVKNAFALLENK